MTDTTLILLSQQKHWPNARKQIAQFSDKGPIIVALDNATWEQFDHQASHISEYQTLPLLSRQRLARDLSKKWYKNDSGEDVSFWQGISTGRTAEIDFFLYFFNILEDIDGVHHLLKAKEPDSVVLFTDDNQYFSSIIQTLNPRVKIEKIASPISERLKKVRSGKYWQTTLKHYCADRFIQYQLTRFYALRQPADQVTTDKRPVAIMMELAEPSSFDTLNEVRESYNPDEVVALAADPRVFKKISQKGGKPHVLASGSSINTSLNFLRGLPLFLQRFRQLHSAPPKLEVHGINIWPIVAPKVRAFFLYQASQTIREFKCLERLVEKQRWGTTVLSTNLHHYGRLCVEMTNHHDLPSFNIQHGVVGSYSYLPVDCTKMAVWGDLVKDWFIGKGVPSEKLVVTGQPRFKNLIPSGKSQQATEDSFTLVFATQPLGVIYQKRLMSTVGDVARAFPKASIIIKIHPSESAISYQEMIDTDQTNVEVWEKDLLLALQNADALVTYNSTVGLEALLMQTPLVIFNPFNWEDEVPYVSGGAGIETTHSDQIVDVVKNLINDENYRENHLAMAGKFIRGYLNINQDSMKNIITAIEGLKLKK